LFFTMDIIGEADNMTALMMIDELREIPAAYEGKPLIFIGHGRGSVNPACFSPEETMTYVTMSAFEIDYEVEPRYYFSSYRILEYLKTLGFGQFQGPSDEMMPAAYGDCQDMPIWPLAGSIKEFEEATMEELMLNAQEESESNAGSDALQKAVEQASIDGYPQALYDACYNSTIEEYQEYAEMFDMDLSEFMGDEDEMEAEVLNWVNEILVSQAIAEKEGFTVTDENFNDDAEELALDYGYDSLEEFTEDYGETYVRLNLIKERAIDFLYEHADLQEVSGEEYYGEDEDLEGALDTEILFEEDME